MFVEIVRCQIDTALRRRPVGVLEHQLGLYRDLKNRKPSLSARLPVHSVLQSSPGVRVEVNGKSVGGL
jgi:hypothetical protein